MKRLLLVLALGGCGAPELVTAPADWKPHLADDWYPFRAAALGIAPDAAVARDGALAEDRPAPIDTTVATEAAAIWRDLCARCHGPTGEPPEPGPGEAPAREWGTIGSRMGFTFGGDKMRAGLYRVIRDGGKPRDGQPSRMPGWSAMLSREQTWGLVRHVESFD